MNTCPQGTSTDTAEVEAQLLQDLEIICDGPDADLHLAFDGVVMVLKSKDRLVWQNSAEQRWMRLDAPARVRLLISWIREAAQLYQGLVSKRTKERKEIA